MLILRLDICERLEIFSGLSYADFFVFIFGNLLMNHFLIAKKFNFTWLRIYIFSLFLLEIQNKVPEIRIEFQELR